MNVSDIGLGEKIAGADRPADPPKVIIWIAPSGLPTICRDIAEASTGASRYAGEHPGKVVGVYELIGSAYVAPSYPEMRPVERENTEGTMITQLLNSDDDPS